PEVKKKKFNKTLILCFDNDEAGRNASQDLANLLFENNIKFDSANIAGDCKDPNEMLVADSAKLKENIIAATKKARLKYYSGKAVSGIELQQKAISPKQWVVKGFLPTGLNLLCAPSKAGKSWMMMQMCCAIAEGKSFLGYETNKSVCHYYALEDGEERLQKRLNLVLNNNKASSNFYIEQHCKTLENGLIGQLEEEMLVFPEKKLFVIDVFQKIRGSQKKGENAYGYDYREATMLKSFADKYKVAVILIHHLRKASDDSDIFNRISGTNGLMACSDNIYILSKKKRTDENTVLSITGRDVEETEIAVILNKALHRWEKLGSAEEIKIREERQEYENEPAVKTAKKIIEINPGGWKGTASDMVIICKDFFDIDKSSPDMGRAVKRYADKLLFNDNIICKTSRSGSARTVSLQKRVPYSRQWQQSINPESDGEND
ncbi:MAG: AAA family ATPase, partial [Clostridia bacterium]|nr:AAA family ATPase [Clostridia bacterium]